MLYLEMFKRAVDRGYREGECSWILETNLLMREGIEAVGRRHHKTYLLYQMSI